MKPTEEPPMTEPKTQNLPASPINTLVELITIKGERSPRWVEVMPELFPFLCPGAQVLDLAVAFIAASVPPDQLPKWALDLAEIPWMSTFTNGEYDDLVADIHDADDTLADLTNVTADISRTLRQCGGTDWQLRDDEPYRSLRAVLHAHNLVNADRPRLPA
jgi:hypothetical protein